MRFCLGLLFLLFAAGTGLRAQNAAPAPLAAPVLRPLNFEQFSALSYEQLSPYIGDYFRRNPEQKGCEKVIRKFFQENPPKLLMAKVQKDAPEFYKGVKAKADAATAGKKKESKYSLDDFLALPAAEHVALSNIAGPGFHALVTEEESKQSIEAMARKEGRAMEMAILLVEMRAQKTTAEEFSGNLAQIIRLAQMQLPAPAP